MRCMRHCVAAALLFSSVVLAVNAQTTTGSIFGDLTDTSGAVLTGVTVRIVNSSTGTNRVTETRSNGSYQFDGLLPAEYAVTVEFPGFRSITRPGVTLPIQGRIKLDFTMEVGTVAESITVTEGAPLVQPTEHVIQTVIGNRLIRDLPLKTHDFMDLALLAPGVVLDQSSVRTGATDSISFLGTYGGPLTGGNVKIR